GYVYALPHEDDVRILRFKEKYDQIPEDTKDPGLMKAKKAMKKKMPTRSPNRQYWNEQQFEKLRTAASRDLASQGPLPWRMLAYMLQLSPDVERVRQLVAKRLMDPKRLEQGQKYLHQMLRTLHALDVVRLEPEPPPLSAMTVVEPPVPGLDAAPPAPKRTALAQAIVDAFKNEQADKGGASQIIDEPADKPPPEYKPEKAYPTERMKDFFVFRSVNPVFALFLIEKLALADEVERLQALESVLELPGSLAKFVRVPKPDDMPPGPLAREHVDLEIVARGLLPADDLYPAFDPDVPFEERKYPPTLADKLRMLFDAEYPGVHGVFTRPVWAAGELLQFGCDFQTYVTSHQLQKQEGLIFRHLLRLVLLLGEFSQVVPPGIDPARWRGDLQNLADQFTACCRDVDPQSTEYMLAHAADRDIVPHEPPLEETSPPPTPDEVAEEAADEGFGAGILDE
ncbi:MAG: helicase, partial [Pirellulales bacterium]